MKQNRPSWDDLRLMKAIAEAGNVLGGAQAIGIDNSTAFRRLARLESALGAKLFERHRKGYELTQEGSEIFALTDRVQQDIEATSIRVSASDKDVVGHIRVATNDSLLFHLLGDIFASFQTKFPGVAIEVLTGNSSLNLSQRDCDVAIRATTNPPENLVGRRLGPIAWAAYESNRSQDDDEPRRWISYGGELSDLKAAHYVNGRVGASHVVFKTSSTDGALAAVNSGIGAGLLPCYLGDASPRIVRLGPPIEELSSSLWILTHPDLRRSRKIRSFMDFCSEALVQHRNVLGGI